MESVVYSDSMELILKFENDPLESVKGKKRQCIAVDVTISLTTVEDENTQN